MKKGLATIICFIMITALLAGCGSNASTTTNSSASNGNSTSASASVGTENTNGAVSVATNSASSSDETYVFMMCSANIEYWNQHKNAMYDVTKELGVKYKIVGVQGSDATEICNALQTVIATKPAGIIIAGYFPDAFKPIFKQAWDAGVPIATTTIDVPDSARVVFIGTNYYNYGKMMVDVAAQSCGGNGKVIVSTSINSGQQSQIDMNNGIKDQVKEKYPNMQIVSSVENDNDADKAAQVVASAMQSHPDASVVIGTTSVAGVGAVTALRETNMLGKVKIVCIDRDTATLDSIKKGEIYATLVGKQYSEVYYAVKFLYDYNHNKVPLVADDKATGVIAQPQTCDPGAVVVNQGNVDAFINYDINKIKDPNYK